MTRAEALPDIPVVESALRLRFDQGTIVVEGLSEGDDQGVPGLKPDPLAGGLYRAPGVWYRSIIEYLRANKILYVDEARKYDKTPWPLLVSKKPFPHQVEALEAWWNNGGKGVVVLPTGAGKTHVANLAINRAARPTIVVTPTIDLLNQWYDELSLSFGVEVGMIGGGSYDVKPLTVTTYDSAYQNLDRLGDRFGLIVFDECHHLPGPTYGQAAVCSLAPFRLGLTATPERSDNQHSQLDALIGPIVFRREITQLRGQFLAEYRVETLFVNLSDEERLRYDQAREYYRRFLQDCGIDMSKPGAWGQFLYVAHRSVQGKQAYLAYREQRAFALRRRRSSTSWLGSSNATLVIVY